MEKICRKHEDLSSSPELVKTKVCELVYTCNPSIEENEQGDTWVWLISHGAESLNLR